MDYIVTPEDRALFKRCRRAWDLGARARRNQEPADSVPGVDIDRAVHEALAVYYFPGMWDWDRAIVLPIVRQAFQRAMDEQRSQLPPDYEEEWRRCVERGERVLDAYFVWAPSVDRFAPVQVQTDVDVPVPDPRDPDRADLVTLHGLRVRYNGQIKLLAIDADDAYWMVDHRVVDEWTDLDHLLLDEQCLSWCWAWRLYYLGMRVTGTVYNELRPDASVPEAASPTWEEGRRSPVAQHRRTYRPPPSEATESGDRIHREEGESFRRTWIRRGDAELDNFGHRLAIEALEMTDPELAIYPNPSPEHCGPCAYRRPCIAMNEGADADAVLAEHYRERPPPPLQEARIGAATWPMGRGVVPPSFGNRR